LCSLQKNKDGNDEVDSEEGGFEEDEEGGSLVSGSEFCHCGTSVSRLREG